MGRCRRRWGGGLDPLNLLIVEGNSSSGVVRGKKDGAGGIELIADGRKRSREEKEDRQLPAREKNFLF